MLIGQCICSTRAA